MAYKKYIKRGGKIYGPYIYHSKRIDGKVVSEYHGPKKESQPKNFIWIGLGAVFLLAIVLIVIFGRGHTGTGNVVLDLNANYQQDQPLSGKLSLSLQQGELLPATSKIVFDNNGQISEYLLSDLTSEPTTEGNFYVSGSSISGTGQGYGVKGQKQIFPEVNFVLNIFSDNQSNTDYSTGSSSTGSDSDNSVVETSDNTTDQNDTFASTETSAVNNSTSPEQQASQNDTVEATTPPETSSSSATGEVVTDSLVSDQTASTSTDVAASDSTETATAAEETAAAVSSETPTPADASAPESSASSDTQATQDSTSSTETSSTDSSAPVTGNIVSSIFGGITNFFLGLTPTGNAVIEFQSEVSGTVAKGNEFVYNLEPGQRAELQPLSVSSDSKTLSDSQVHLTTEGNRVIVTTDYSQISEGFGQDYTGSDQKDIAIDLSKTGFVPQAGNLKVSLVDGSSEIISLETVLQDEGVVAANNSIEIPIVNETPVLNETNVTGINQSNVSVITVEPTVVPIELTTDEIITLYNKFGDAPVKIGEAKTRNGILTVRYTLGDYWIENSYPDNLDNVTLQNLMKDDVIRWQKDLAKRFSEPKASDAQEVENFSEVNFTLIG